MTTISRAVDQPHHKVPKTYQIKAGDLLTDEQIGQLRNSVELDEVPRAPPW